MSDQTVPQPMPKLWEEPRDPYHRWIWRAPDNTFIAGFKERDAAVAYGERNGWRP